MKGWLFFRKPVEPETPTQITLRDRLISIIEVNLIRFPFVQPLRIVWYDLQTERRNWPWLLPLLAYIGWRTYRAERRKALRGE